MNFWSFWFGIGFSLVSLKWILTSEPSDKENEAGVSEVFHQYTAKSGESGVNSTKGSRDRKGKGFEMRLNSAIDCNLKSLTFDVPTHISNDR